MLAVKAVWLVTFCLVVGLAWHPLEARGWWYLLQVHDDMLDRG